MRKRSTAKRGRPKTRKTAATPRTRARRTKARRPAPRRPAVRRRGKARAAQDSMVFEVRWAGGGTATLEELLDNQRLVGAGVTESSPLEHPYRATAATTHVVRWVLSFPGRKLTNLAAKARKNGGPAKPLKSAGEATGRWAAEGDH